jgi:hypothetical protein
MNESHVDGEPSLHRLANSQIPFEIYEAAYEEEPDEEGEHLERRPLQHQ